MLIPDYGKANNCLMKERTVNMKKSVGGRVFETVNALFMCFMILIMLYPLLYVLFASFSEPASFMMHRGVLLKPAGFSTYAYKMMAGNTALWRGFGNTFIIEILGVSTNVLLTSFGAYFLTRREFPFRRQIMFLIVFTMYFSGGTIPFYFAVRNLGLEDSYLALVLPVAINTFNLIVLRTAYQSVPESLYESAQLDGAGHFRILFKIFFPLTKATTMVIVLYYAVEHWNSWFNAMLFLSSREKFPLQLILREILLQNDTSAMTQNVDTGDRSLVSQTIQYAVIIVSTLPILCVYPFIQKYFVKGVMVGAVKE